MIKYEQVGNLGSTSLFLLTMEHQQLHIAGPITNMAQDPNVAVPGWDGLALIDVPTFNVGLLPVHCCPSFGLTHSTPFCALNRSS